MPELSSLAVYANTDWRLEVLATAMQAASEEDILAVWRMAQRSPDQGAGA